MEGQKKRRKRKKGKGEAETASSEGLTERERGDERSKVSLPRWQMGAVEGGQSLSLKRTGYPGDREGQQKYNSWALLFHFTPGALGLQMSTTLASIT